MKALYKLNICMPDSANLEGLFIIEREYVEYLINSGMEIYFGEIAGKHTCVHGSLDWDDITFVTDDAAVLDMMEQYNLCIGINPFGYDPYPQEFNETIYEIIKNKLT